MPPRKHRAALSFKAALGARKQNQQLERSDREVLHMFVPGAGLATRAPASARNGVRPHHPTRQTVLPFVPVIKR